MPIAKPYYRTVRQFVNGNYFAYPHDEYFMHPSYAMHPENYIRAFEIIQKDLLAIFESVEPADQNLPTYSFRMHELLMRTCIELEANFKAILAANTYSKTGNLNITDYYKIDVSHYLSEYEVRLPYWTGTRSVWKPFDEWRANAASATPWSLAWYSAYNAAKHDRAGALSQANLENLLYAITGLEVVLSAQFFDFDFGPIDYMISRYRRHQGFDPGIGGYFSVKFPQNTPAAERYEFVWPALVQTLDPIDKFDYDSV
jgi:hypothetical protein